MNSDVNAIIQPFATKIRLDNRFIVDYKKTDRFTFVMTPILDTTVRMGNQIPMSWDLRGNGRFHWVKALNASIRISATLFNRAHSGPSGKATTKNVIKPNWMTLFENEFFHQK